MIARIKELLLFWKKKQEPAATPAAKHERLDMQILQHVRGRKIPRPAQYKYLFRVLQPADKRKFLISVLIFVVALSTLGTRSYLNNTVAVAASGGTYTEGLVGTPRFINPLLAPSNDVDRDISSLVFSGLMKFDADGSLIPDLASQYRVSDDQREYTFELKEGVTWHNGEPLTIDDVIYTIQTIQDPAFKSPLRVTFSGVQVSRIDQRTISFNLAEPFPSFLSALTVGIIPQHIWYSIPSAQAHLAEVNIKPIGSGPYKFKGLTKDTNGSIRNIALEKNTEYYGDVPYIDELAFKFYPDVESALEALQNKNVEGLGFLPLEHKAVLESNSSINLYTLDLPQHRAIFFNPNMSDIIKDKNIRRALAYSIDRNRIVQQALQGNGTAITLPIIPGFSPEPSEDAPLNFSPGEATSILEENSWTLNEETGVRTKDDVELRVVLTTVDQQENINAANIIKENWEAIGIGVDLNIVSRTRIKKDVIEPRDYQILLFGQITSSSQDVYAFWHSSQTAHPGNNLSVFANKDIDAALEELRNATSIETEKELVQQVTDKITTEVFSIFLYTPSYIYPVSTKIKGIGGLDAVSYPSDRFDGIDRWYIKTSRQRNI